MVCISKVIFLHCGCSVGYRSIFQSHNDFRPCVAQAARGCHRAKARESCLLQPDQQEWICTSGINRSYTNRSHLIWSTFLNSVDFAKHDLLSMLHSVCHKVSGLFADRCHDGTSDESCWLATAYPSSSLNVQANPCCLSRLSWPLPCIRNQYDSQAA